MMVFGIELKLDTVLIRDTTQEALVVYIGKDSLFMGIEPGSVVFDEEKDSYFMAVEKYAQYLWENMGFKGKLSFGIQNDAAGNPENIIVFS
jgi:hypothetical protein